MKKNIVLRLISPLLLVVALTMLLLMVNVVVAFAQEPFIVEQYVEVDTVQSVDWADDVNNPDNLEYVMEVYSNYFDDIPLEDILFDDMQLMFVFRYYNTCTERTKKWFDRVL